MKDRIEFVDTAEERTALLSIVRCLEPEAHQYRWSILELEAVGDPQDLPMGVLEIESRAAEGEWGFEVDWRFVGQLAAALRDVWDLVLLGWQGANCPERGDSSTWSECAFIIERLDSTVWRCSVPHDFTGRFLRAFPHARVAGKDDA